MKWTLNIGAGAVLMFVPRDQTSTFAGVDFLSKSNSVSAAVPVLLTVKVPSAFLVTVALLETTQAGVVFL